MWEDLDNSFVEHAFVLHKSKWVNFFIIMSQHATEKSVLFVSYLRLAGWLGWGSGWQILQNSPSAYLQVVHIQCRRWNRMGYIDLNNLKVGRNQTTNFFLSTDNESHWLFFFLIFLQLWFYETLNYSHLVLKPTGAYFRVKVEKITWHKTFLIHRNKIQIIVSSVLFITERHNSFVLFVLDNQMLNCKIMLHVKTFAFWVQ